MELQGFKTFAKKTVLTFPEPKNNTYPITCIVGPNGSGKSNIADALRWCLGEQSLKLLRSKKTEDIIFSGSEGQQRSGFAEVVLTFDNQKKIMPLEVSEVEMTRRLYRDGQSEYLINGRQARLADVQHLLAEAHVGQRSYSVIGQGMVDHILLSTPEERKQFFDDATGVKSLQLKRHEAVLKFKKTRENLNEIELLLQELTPRLRSLKRQVSHLQQREEVEKQLKELEQTYYGILWWNLQEEKMQTQKQLTEEQKEIHLLTKRLAQADSLLIQWEREEKKEETKNENLLHLQQILQKEQQEYRMLQTEELRLEKTIELAKIRAQENWSPLPLSQIIQELQTLVQKQKKFQQTFGETKEQTSFDILKKSFQEILKQVENLLQRLQRPDTTNFKPDPALLKAQEENKKLQKAKEQDILTLEQEMILVAQKEKQLRYDFFEKQKQARLLQQELHVLEQKENTLQISLAREEERLQSLEREIREQTKESVEYIQNHQVSKQQHPEKLYPEIQRLRSKRDIIGGIDPEIIKEHEEISQRHTFLDEQMKDLTQAISSLEHLLEKLDKDIHIQSEESFEKINKAFQHFFKILFLGGTCRLVKMTEKQLQEQQESEIPLGKEEKEKWKKTNLVVGIEIEATPPGKRLKSLHLLSGGERALTSLALISAIMTVNPSPFVVLDEVDAALDEANTTRFGNILDELKKQTEFIVITHNRSTMEKADILYGVTVSEKGTSRLLSVHLEQLTKEIASFSE